jgi:hypothetical protein
MGESELGRAAGETQSSLQETSPHTEREPCPRLGWKAAAPAPRVFTRPRRHPLPFFRKRNSRTTTTTAKKSNFPRRPALFRNPKIPDSSGPGGRPEPINKSNASQDLYDKTF